MAQSELERLARELLDNYRHSAEQVIYEYSGNISGDLKELASEISDYEAKITLAAKGR